MILVDTSVWVQHFRVGDAGLAALLAEGRVAMHPFILGELALGSLQNRARVLDLLGALPALEAACDEDVLRAVEQQELFGSGLGYVDVCLIVAALQAGGIHVWTYDRRLAKASAALGVAWPSAGA